MAEEQITLEPQATTENVATPAAPSQDANGADAFFGNDPVEVRASGEKKPEEITPGGEAVKPSEEPIPAEFIPGKYKTPEDAIRSLDKGQGRLSQILGDINEKLTRIASPQNTQRQEVNPSTGQPFTQAEINAELQAEYERDPIGFNSRLVQNQLQSVIPQVAAKVSKDIIWQDFVEKNPEMNNRQAVDNMRVILESFPILQTKKNALYVAKEILTSPGNTPDEKYENWILSKKNNGNGKDNLPIPPPAPQLPGQGGIDKRTPTSPNDNWSAFSRGIF